MFYNKLKEGVNMISKVQIAESRNFLSKLFKSMKPKKKPNPLIQVSDRFTPEEKALILGNNIEQLNEIVSIYKIPFRAELVPNIDPSIRKALLKMGSRTLYVDFNKASKEEINAQVNDLIYHPNNFYI